MLVTGEAEGKELGEVDPKERCVLIDNVACWKKRKVIVAEVSKSRILGK